MFNRLMAWYFTRKIEAIDADLRKAHKDSEHIKISKAQLLEELAQAETAQDNEGIHEAKVTLNIWIPLYEECNRKNILRLNYWREIFEEKLASLAT